MGRLTEAEYAATIAGRPRPVNPRHTSARWRPYLASLPPAEWLGNDFSSGVVAAIYDMAGLRWRHVLLAGDDPRVQLALVINLRSGSVHGHYVLDLRDRVERDPVLEERDEVAEERDTFLEKRDTALERRAEQR